MGFRCDVDTTQTWPAATSPQIHGATGRIIVLQFPGQVDQDTLEALNDIIAAQVDEDLYSALRSCKTLFSCALNFKKKARACP